MSKKRKNIKKRKKQRKIFRISFLKNFKIISLIFILLVIVFSVYILLYKSRYFELKEIETTGEYPLAPLQIIDLTSLEKGISIWSFNLSRLSNRIKDLYPQYREIIIKRELPDKIIIHFELRIPVAQIKSGRYFLVDKEGFILPQVRNIAMSELPVIRGIDLKLLGVKPGKPSRSKAIDNSLRLLQALKNSEEFSLLDLVFIDASDYKNLFFELENGIIIKIGNQDFKERIKKLDYIMSEIKNGEIAYIDLRFKDPVLSPR